jgi:hypothetical protein
MKRKIRPSLGSLLFLVFLSGVTTTVFEWLFQTTPVSAASKIEKTGSTSEAKSRSEFIYFNSNDAAPLMGVSADQVNSRIEKGHEGFWMCTFSADQGKKIISFSVTVSKSVKTATEEMERYRENLETAASVKPFKNNLPAGAYSDIMGLGDEAVWTDINGTLTARKGHISIQVTNPKEKKEQIKVIQAFFKKL